VKLSCTKENLHQGLQIVSRISGKQANLPILENVLVQTDGSGVKLISTNLEMAITCHIRGRVDQEGEYTVPSKLFNDFVNLLPNERVDIDLLDDSLLVKCQNTRTKIKGMKASDFPLLPSTDEGHKFNFSIHEFRELLQKTLFSASTNEARPELSGIFMSFNREDTGKGKLLLASTDSYRLSEAVGNISSGDEAHIDVIVPQRALSELNRVLAVFKDDVEAPATIQMTISDDQVVFRYGSVELISRKIEGSYPDYRQIIPKQHKTIAELHREEFIQAIRTASLFSKQGLYDVRLAFKPEEGLVEIFANDSGRGEHVITLPSAMTGIQNTIVLNYRYLIDGLNAIDTSNIKISIVDGGNPCLVHPEGESADINFQYIVMPIRQ
jgi:DNA polymerase-3 subunit beta